MTNLRIPAPVFDELYVVSDLHLGGPAGFQIFNAGTPFARLTDHLRARAGANRRVALLINGDLVDFLAERPFAHFDPGGAVEKLDRIAKDPAFQPVWDGLRRFANTDRCHLFINLGNHDLELALPWVRARLLDILSDDAVKARGQITLALDGAGIRCRVGGADVLAVHGNEVDDWNLADYETIRRIGRDITQGVSVETWIPNAGSRLVIEVMNDIKGRFPFVDLLKPEIGAVIPTILALAPDQRNKVDGIRRTVGRLLVDKVRQRIGLLGDEAQADGGVAQAQAARARTGAAGLLSPGNPAYATDLLDQAEMRLADNTQPLSLIDADARGDYLSARAAVVKFLRRESTSEVLREALERLGTDRSFDLDHEDDQFRLLDEKVGDVDFLLAGHTHLERVIPRKCGRGTYINSGTWVRVIRFDKATMGNQAVFAGLFDTFKAGTMQALDARPELVQRLPGVVTIWAEQGRVIAELRRAGLESNDAVMTPVPGGRIDS